MLLATGVAPAAASAAVHFSEIGTTLVSGFSHHKLGNVDWRTVSIIAVPGGLGDTTMPHLPQPEFAFGAIVSGVDEMRRCVRMFCKYGVDSLKINLSGESITGMTSSQSQFTEAEVTACVDEAKRWGKRVAAHARSTWSIKECVRQGIEVIYHASYTDEEALDMLEARVDQWVARVQAS